MNLIQKGHRHNHRGIIGIESAIVLIAFVIVAAALAFVVLNMGFATTQKAKTTIVSTLSEAGSSLEVEGRIIASSYRPAVGTGSLNVTSIPVKIVGSGDSVNLDPAVTAIKYLSNKRTYDNIYGGTLNPTTYKTLQSATNAAAPGIITQSPYTGGLDADSDDWPSKTKAFIYWTIAANTNNILEGGEHANIAIAFSATDRPSELDKIRVEVIVSSGASLTVERTVPNITSAVVDLG